MRYIYKYTHIIFLKKKKAKEYKQEVKVFLLPQTPGSSPQR